MDDETAEAESRWTLQERQEWDPNPFILWLTNQMRDRGWTASELSRAVGVTASTVSRWLTPHLRLQPRAAMARRLAEALEVDLDEVLVLIGHRPPAPVRDPARDEVLRLLDQVDLSRDHRDSTLTALLKEWRRQDRQVAGE